MYKLQNYHTKPATEPLFKGKPTFEKLYMGVELEFEPKNPRDAQNLMDRTFEILQDFVVIKQDNSLLHGFEICSRPASLEFHKEKWVEFFEKVVPDLQTFYLLGRPCNQKFERCGMHVHINREPLSLLQIGKMVAFLHKKENYDFIKRIAGRESNSYCNYKFYRGFKDAKPEHYRVLNRKVGINLHNDKTVEIRIFKGTTDIKTFFKNLEFCEALTRFTFPGHTKIQDSTKQQNFIDFIYETPDYYPNLIAFLEPDPHAMVLQNLTKFEKNLCPL